MEKVAHPDHPILPLITQRWSPRTFSPQPLGSDTLASLFEAARWSASSYNAQPWSFFVATQDQPEAYQKLLDCLIPFNQAWAKQAPVLVAIIAQLNFKHNGKPNGWAHYDAGQSAAILSLQATSMGLFVHQMAGFEPDKVTQLLSLSEEFQPAAMMAIGYPGDPASLPAELQEQELAPRIRQPLSSFVFAGSWGQPAPFAQP